MWLYVGFSAPKGKELYDVESQELVLDVGGKNKVILARKIPGQRSQLWKLTADGQF